MSPKTLLSIATSCILMSSMFAYAKTEKLDGYYLVAMTHSCDLVAKEKMTEDQVNAYLDLKQLEDEIEKAEQPIEVIESEIEILSEQIEEVVDRAVYSNNGITTIDENLLDEQRKLADELESLMLENEPSFELLEAVARKIESKAEVFDELITSSLQGKDYDIVTIVSPDEKPTHSRCNQTILSM